MTQARFEHVRQRLGELDIDALLLSVGADLPWLTGYTAMPLERLTMLVLPADGDATLVVPRLEAPRVTPHPELFGIRPWDETEDPVAIVAELVGRRCSLAISNRAWAAPLLALQASLPDAKWQPASVVTGPLRAVKDVDEITALRNAAAAADRVATALVEGEIELVGRTEAAVSREISDRLIEQGNEHVNFAIVGSGPNAASPHHDASERVIGREESVVCDFGGTMNGYCSDITRTVFTGEPPAEFRDLYTVLERAQAEAVGSVCPGIAAEDIDGVARRIITEGGYGANFVHRTGHGIGLEEHEDPFIVAGNCEGVTAGNAFSIEPGIYIEGKWGARIEDIVVVTDHGADSLNTVDRSL
ncbi:MAG: aminopeptidase P family protein, partial [Acidimicrobiia bacterium]|nr:aminopeptidase P family protein [Acidimicrobiia bacterium]